jgi:3-phosphoshikimate 1-carboxyvinyltransferase
LDRIEISGAKAFKGEVSPTPDKSISHRAVIFSSLAKGKSVIRNFLRAEDPMSTVGVMRALGVEIREEGGEMTVEGKGLFGLSEPDAVLDCGNSGTTMRLLSGVLSGQPFFSVLTGDASLRKRPMARVIAPLSSMGARILARAGDRYPPVAIKGGRLMPIDYKMPVASAQLKSALLLAGLYAEGRTLIAEPLKSRDHTERMLPFFGADLLSDGRTVTISGGTELSGTDVYVPGDFSSAAFFLVGALLLKDSDITIRNTGLNPTRTGLLDVLGRMGAQWEIMNRRDIAGEPVADIHVRRGGGLRAADISGEEIPALIDEFPVICVAATQAEGTTSIRGAEELRVKESDRIGAMVSELRKMGAEIEELKDGVIIKGSVSLRGAEVDSHGDHRIAMAMAIAALAAEGTTKINGISSVNISFPGFFDLLGRLS